MKTREKRDKMLLTLALLEQLEQDEELKEFESCERRENRKGNKGAQSGAAHVFSRQHEERMEQLFKMAALQEKKKKRRRRMRKAAAGLAACLAVSVYMGFTSSAFRTPVLNFFTEVRETYSELLVEKDDRKGVTEHFQEYEPEYTVKGFYVSSVVRFLLLQGAVQFSGGYGRSGRDRGGDQWETGDAVSEGRLQPDGGSKHSRPVRSGGKYFRSGGGKSAGKREDSSDRIKK